jgi:hypothetical protein
VSRESPPESLHRRWLHALEDDSRVPYYALQVARVYADFAASAADGRVHVRWSMLLRCTHQRRDRLSQSLAYLVDNGWLTLEPYQNGQRKYYRLASPAPAIHLASSNGSRP